MGEETRGVEILLTCHLSGTCTGSLTQNCSTHFPGFSFPHTYCLYSVPVVQVLLYSLLFPSLE